MKKFGYVLLQECKKTVLNYGFLGCVLLSFCFFFSTTIILGSESVDEGITVLSCIIQYSSTQLNGQESCTNVRVFTQSVSGFFQMFLPIIAAFPFIPNFCEERNSGLIRFMITRTGKKKYYLGKFCTALLGGGLAVTLGYLLYGMVVFSYFPSYIALTGEEVGQVLPMIIDSVLGIFLYGMVSVMPAFLMSTVLKNRYLVTCIPFSLLYLYGRWVSKIQTTGWIRGDQFLINLSYILSPCSITQLQYLKIEDNWNQNLIAVLLFQGGFVVIGFLLFCFLMNRRWDSGT